MFSHMASKRTLELNPTNLIVKELKKVAEDKVDESVCDVAYLLFETALLTSGFTLDDPTSFAKRIHRMISLGLDVDGAEEAMGAEASELMATDDVAPAAEGTSTLCMKEIN